MAADDRSDRKDAERQKLLEEIRKRAEEAELKRIEEEERRTASGRASRLSTEKPSLERQAEQQKINDLRERLTIALDRGKLDKALGIYNDLKGLLHDEVELKKFHNRIVGLQEEEERVKEAVEAGGPEAETNQKKVTELLERAGTSYQFEQYEQGLALVREILTLDPENFQALDLRKNIESAQRLSEQIKQEEAQRRAAEARLFPQSPEEKPAPVKDEKVDAWGPTPPPAWFGEPLLSRGEQAAPAVPPRLPIGRRILALVSRIRIPWKSLAIAAAVAVLCVLIYFVFDYFRSVVAPPKYSLLVLPAKNESADSVLEHLSDGITQDLIADLSAVTDLRVFGPATSLFFKRSGEPPGGIARLVGANYVLQWFLSRDSEMYTIRAGLSDTLSEGSLWTSEFKNSVRELPVVRLEIARAILGKIGVASAAQASSLQKAAPTSVAAAYEAYLVGRSLLQNRDGESLRLAIETLDYSCRADSTFTDALVALAWAHVLSFDRGEDTSVVHLQEAGSLVRRAVALGSNTSEMHRVKGLIERFRLEYDNAMQELELAVSIAPSDAESQRRLSELYVIRNRLDDALKAAQLAAADDPYNVDSYTSVALVQQFRGEFKEALRSYEAGMPLASDASEYASGYYSDMFMYVHQPERAIQILNERIAHVRQQYVDYYKLGRVYQIAGKSKQEWEKSFSRAKDLIAERVRANPGDAVAHSYAALVHMRLGEAKEAAAAIARAQQLGGTHAEVLYNIARAYSVRRNNQQALEHLTNALDRHYRPSTLLDMDFYNLRSEPEFHQAIFR